jgi:hypothetical protein
MSAFIRLPITSAASLGTIPANDIRFFDLYEQGTYDHWIFNRGTPANLTGRTNGRLLTLQSTAPVYSGSFLTLPRVDGQALLTDRDDSATATDTLFAVVRASADLASNSMQIMGSLGATTGYGIFFHSTAFPKVLRVTARASVFANDLAGDSSNSAVWVFVAMARNFSGATKLITSLRGGGLTYNLSAAATYTPSAGKISLGNAYTTALGAGGMDVAEFGIFDRALTGAELQSLYVRRKREMAKVGISVL